MSEPDLLRSYTPTGEQRAGAPAPVSPAPPHQGHAPEPGGGAEIPPPPPLLPDKPEPPLAKRIERGITALFKLGRTETMAKRSARALQRLDPELYRLHTLTQRVEALSQAVDGAHRKGDIANDSARHIADQLAALRDDVDSLKTGRQETGLALHLLSRRMDARDRADRPAPPPSSAGAGAPPDWELRDFLDRFYHRLEESYRGAETEIARRLSVYLPDMQAAVDRTGGGAIVDLGCGRGEWLALLREAGLQASGYDTNPVQLQSGTARGLDLREGDALAALEAQEAGSLAAVTAHHLIEHLPFEEVARITRAAFRALAPGGVLLYETPNTGNVIVGATTFHTDPTHLKPMPEQVLHVLLEEAGFDPVERRRLNPHERLNEFLARDGFDNELAHLLFGPQDLAVLGTKPAGGGPGAGEG